MINTSTVVGRWQQIIRFFPIILLLLFCLYAATVIMYRTLTFNTCESAAAELQLVSYKKCLSLNNVIITYYITLCVIIFQQIEEAKKDLQSKGVILKETSPLSS